jgi:hypothetical protein
MTWLKNQTQQLRNGKDKNQIYQKKLHPGASDGLLPHLSSKKKTGPQQRELLHRKRQQQGQK